MDLWLIVLIAVIAVVVVAAAVWFGARRRRQQQLKRRFGPEYDRAVRDRQDRRDAEEELARREQRRERLEIRELDGTSRRRYRDQWRDIQQTFVDQPGTAVREADELIQAVMRERGYPVEDFEQRAADLSTDHPKVVEHYREGHRLATTAEPTGDATEDLRTAMLHYRELFERLVGSDTDPGDTAARTEQTR